MNAFETYDKKLVYDFHLGYGGIGDYIKFFVFILEDCIKTKTRLYLKKNNLEIENYIQLNYKQMYIEDCNGYHVTTPQNYYSTFCLNFTIPIKDVFHFTNEVIENSFILFPQNIPYLSIHLRMGDFFLETDKQYVMCHDDVRNFSEEKIHAIIETNTKNIFFCGDNNYKLKIKEKYPSVMITNCDIGHTSFSNTTKKQVLDTITEFYILTNSEKIYGITRSGFSIIASKFHNIPYETFCNNRSCDYWKL